MPLVFDGFSLTLPPNSKIVGIMAPKKRKYPVGIQSFESIRQDGYVYVDKTALIHRIAVPGKGQLFIARPRRFGKSLLISTLQCLFEGRRDLFRGLAIDSLPWDWTPIPVLRLDMGSSQANSGEELLRRLDGQLDNLQHDLGLDPEPWDSATAHFRNICRAAAAKSPTGKIAILVDEYDKPLLGLKSFNHLTVTSVAGSHL